MLPVEFYLVNASTALLWLLQNCSHEVLMILIAFGAVALGLVFVIVVGKLATDILEFVLILLDFIYKSLLLIISPPKRTRSIRRAINTSNQSEQSRSINAIEPSRIEGIEDRSPVSSSMTLHPVQWDVPEARETQFSRLAPQALDAIASSSRSSGVSPPRRSRRANKPRSADQL